MENTAIVVLISIVNGLLLVYVGYLLWKIDRKLNIRIRRQEKAARIVELFNKEKG